MRATSSCDDDPRQALHRLLGEWILSLQSRDRWEGTYAELASELHAVRATNPEFVARCLGSGMTRADLEKLAREADDLPDHG